MASRNLEKLRSTNEEWKLVPPRSPVARQGPGVGADRFLDQLLASGRLKVVDRSDLQSQPRRGGVSVAQIEMDVESDAAYLLMVRHTSGAINYHFPSQVERRSTGRDAVFTRIRFVVPIPETLAEPEQRRGFVSKVIHAVAMKIVGKLADRVIDVAGRLAETAAWKFKGLEEGWKHVTLQGLQAASLPKIKIADAVSVKPGERNLLLLHGTFSHASSAFAGLATSKGSGGSTFFHNVKAIYQDRIFAFDHFTVSRSPLENAQALLDGLPGRPCSFDVITHSRGGLVLRTLVEDEAQLKSPSRFSLGRSVLVASPNEGTPLASPSHFDRYVTWISNLIDLFPENPFTIAAHFIAEALTWLARAVLVDLPGLAAMNSEGAVIRQLQGPPGPPVHAYSALVANYQPDQGMLQRMLDTGVDVFFGTANDLVVPTEGGWRVGPSGTPVIAANQIGCFGLGGNLQNPPNEQVTHISFFSRSTTVDFLTHVLLGQPLGIATLDPATHLPFRGRRGVIAAGPPQPVGPSAITAPSLSIVRAPETRTIASAEIVPASGWADEVFYLAVLNDGKEEEVGKAILQANFRNARVVERMPTRGPIAGRRFQRIIEAQRTMQRYLDGDPNVHKLPHGDELVNLGKDLFDTLFPGRLRRLYDIARAAQPDGRLNLVFTSMISWLADLPWEFAYDSERKNFLATSEVNFTRNVYTAIPADRIPVRLKLRILVVVAQPLGLAHLSVEEETEVIRSGFRRLIDDGLGEVDVLLDATPDLLHRTLEVARAYDVLHFIGHGEYDKKAKIGSLIFENEEGAVQPLDSQVLQQVVCRRDIRLMFLNACETGKGGPTDFNKGVAPALVAAGVPAVVANQFSVLDISATAFARHFYWVLAQGRTIGDAAREARVAVNYSISGEAIDWAVPVVFARNPADRLTEYRAGAAREIEHQQKVQLEADRTQRRSLQGPDKGRDRIGLWDVHRTIPGLDKIADKLTAVQQEFILKAVSITAPLGTWRREKAKGVAYLNAEDVAERLKGKPRELGLDRLIAFTIFPLRDEEESGLISWDDAKNEICIFSTYELLESIQPPLSIDRMVANAVAWFVSRLETHQKPRNCVSYRNDEVDIKYIAGPLQLCDRCRRKLKGKPALRNATEQLLKAYL